MSTQRISMQLKLVDNSSFWPLLAAPEYMYSGARRDGGTVVKYFHQGVDLISASLFLEKYRSHTTYVPPTRWVLVCSINTGCPVGNGCMFKHRNRKLMAVGVEIAQVRDYMGNAYADVSGPTKPKYMTFSSTSINYRSGIVGIEGRAAAGSKVLDSGEELVSMIKAVLIPVVEQVESMLTYAPTNIYTIPTGKEMVFRAMRDMMAALKIHDVLAAEVREQLINWINGDMDGHVVGKFLADGVYYEDEIEYRHWVAKWKDRGIVQRLGREKPLFQHLTEEYPYDYMARLKEITWEQLQQPVLLNEPCIDWTQGLTEEELRELYKEMLSDGSSMDAVKLYEWRNMVGDRWHMAHNMSARTRNWTESLVIKRDHEHT